MMEPSCEMDGIDLGQPTAKGKHQWMGLIWDSQLLKEKAPDDISQVSTVLTADIDS